MLTERAVAYAEAHAMRFDRISDSMAGDHSRKIPTLQEISVGNFRLEPSADKSDKSAAMSSIHEVRNRIHQAIERGGDGPVALAGEWGLERNDLRDFLNGRKNSLKPEVLQLLAEKYGIPFHQLIITRQKKKRKAA